MKNYKKVSLIVLITFVVILSLSLLINAIISSTYGNRTKAFFKIMEQVSSDTQKIIVRRQTLQETTLHNIITEKEEIDNIIKIISDSLVADSSIVFNGTLPKYTLQFLDSNNKEVATFNAPNIFSNNLKISIVLSDYESLKKIIE